MNFIISSGSDTTNREFRITASFYHNRNIKSTGFVGSRIWHAIPSSGKESRTLNHFKRTIKHYDFDGNCRLSKLCRQFGFLVCNFIIVNMHLRSGWLKLAQ